jgi:hypothetical protein
MQGVRFSCGDRGFDKVSGFCKLPQSWWIHMSAVCLFVSTKEKSMSRYIFPYFLHNTCNSQNRTLTQSPKNVKSSLALTRLPFRTLCAHYDLTSPVWSVLVSQASKFYVSISEFPFSHVLTQTAAWNRIKMYLISLSRWKNSVPFSTNFRANIDFGSKFLSLNSINRMIYHPVVWIPTWY